MLLVIRHVWNTSEPITSSLLFALFVNSSRNVCVGYMKTNGRFVYIKVRVILFTATLPMHVGEFTNISIKRGHSGFQTLNHRHKIQLILQYHKMIGNYQNVIGRLCSWQFCYPEGKNQGKNDRRGWETMITFHLLLKHSNCTF